MKVDSVLGRPERSLPLGVALGRLRSERVLVTGARGSIGEALVAMLVGEDVEVCATDIDSMDVRFAESVRPVMQREQPSLVFHLAGAKHAPEGELDPHHVATVNFEGTWNVLRQAELVGARAVLASTGKAADPETAYGASKLLAERMVLNAGGSVARFFNVVESCGNVFRIWEGLPADAPLPVASCRRFFVSLAEAVSLLVAVSVAPSGRYVFDPGEPRWMGDVAAALYPGRAQVEISPRRGDRVLEPKHASSELLLATEMHGLLALVSPHDQVLLQVEAESVAA